MIKKKLTDQYFKQLDILSEALYLCWQNAYNYENNTLDKTVLKYQIRSYGIHNESEIRKEYTTDKINRFIPRIPKWTFKLSDFKRECVESWQVEFHEHVINEIESNLFRLTNKADKIAYANILLRDINKRYIHKRNIDEVERNNRHREMFQYVLNREFIFKSDVKTLTTGEHETYPNYNLTFRLSKHFNFIDRLIELFICFEIDIVILAKKSKYKLYTFERIETENQVEAKFKSSLNSNFDLIENGTGNLQKNVYPKFNSTLSDECLIKIMHYLLHKKKLINPNTDIWLFWFNRNYIKVPVPLTWDDSPTLLSNVIQHLCGESIAATVKIAFDTTVYVKPTKKRYERSKMHKEIEQIITISMQKNN
ncbi:MAG: hypothetical protein PHR83_07955 [Paludibacter sp.]|nr:hypothetical protein [Paludibacter sp.]